MGSSTVARREPTEGDAEEREVVTGCSPVAEVARRCTEVESGARNVDNILTNTLLPEVSKQILGKMAEGEKPASIRVSVGSDGAFVYE